MTNQTPIEPCTQCNAAIAGNYCAQCGHPKALKRIDGHYVFSEVVSVLNFDKGIFYTIKELLLRPGKNVQKFIHTDRNRLVKPIIFVIVCSLLYTLAQRFLGFEDGYVSAGGFGDSSINNIYSWIQSNYGYANILMAVFIAGWIKLFFRKYAYNFFEILVLLCFVMGIGMLLYTTFGILETISGIKLLFYGGILGMGYTAWAIGQFFESAKTINYLKGILAYLLGMISFYFLATLLGLGVDLLF